MDREELLTRASQACTQRLDAIRYRLGRAPSVTVRPDGGAAPRFFFDADEVPGLIDLIRDRLPDECRGIVRRAEAICRHEFDLLGYEGLDFGAGIDWHLDPVSGKRAPFLPWYNVPFLDFERVGDSKVTWELNRHQHLVVLARAYRLTGEASFAEEIGRQWRDWWQSNPYPMGTNWASALEVAFRGISWLWVKHLLSGSEGLSREQADEIDRGLALSGRHLELYLSTYFSANTHLLGEAVALFFIGLLVPGAEPARRWRERGWEVLREEARRQYLPDGLHFERSSYYHVYALDLLLHARILARRNGVEGAEELDEGLRRQLDVLAALSDRGGVFRFGDDDGGRLFDGARNRREHLLDPLATGAALFRRGDLAGLAGGLREETAWLMGADGVARFDQLSPEPEQHDSRTFRDSRMYVMSSAGPPSCRLLIGPGVAPGLVGGHAHADLLALQLCLGGEEVLVDAGTFVYVDDDGQRDRFRSTAAHNTLEVDGRGQAEPTGPFSWRGNPTALTDLWIGGEDFDLFIGHHDGYSRPAERLVHRRWVFSLKSGFVLVRDVVEGTGSHRLDVRWHVAAGTRLKQAAPGVHVAGRGDEAVLALITPVDDDGNVFVEQGSVSPVYGKKESRHLLRYAQEAVVPAELATVLQPVSAPAPAGELRRCPAAESDSAAVVAYTYSTSEAEHLIAFADPGTEWRLGDWKSDARFVHCTLAAGAVDPSSARVVDGSYLSCRERRYESPETAGVYWTWRS